LLDDPEFDFLLDLVKPLYYERVWDRQWYRMGGGRVYGDVLRPSFPSLWVEQSKQ